MKRNNILTAVLIAAISYCSHAALAVSDFVIGMYDADAGNPANAGEIQSPELQGWTEWASGVQGQDPNLAVQEGVIGNDSTNAWLNDDQLGNTNPGYFIDVDAATQRGMFDFGWKYENVMTMTRGDHFTAFGVSSSNPWGLASNSRVGFEPGTNGSTITFAPIDDGSAATIVTPSGTVGDFYRVVVTGDAQATSGTFEVFDFSTGSQEGVTQDYTGWTTGSSNNANRLGIQSGSSSGDNRTAQIHSMSLVIPAPDTLTLEVNKISGATRLVNNSSSVIIFNGYFIESAGNQLDLNAWASLQSIDLDGNGTPDDGIGWEEFDASGTAILAEAFFTGSSTLSPSGSLDLGNAYNPAIAGVGNDGDLSFKLTDTAGRLIPSSLFSTVEYVTDGDFDGDNDIDGSDFLTWQRGFPTPPHDTAGLALWEANYGAGAGQLAIINAVPEPGGLVLLSVGVALLRFRRTPA